MVVPCFNKGGTSASKLIQEFMRMSLRRWEVDMETLPNKRKKI